MSSSQTSRTYKPTYLSMIRKAIRETTKTATSDRSKVSYQAIAKYIEENYPVNESLYKTYLKKALKKAVEDKKLVQVKMSFRMPIQKTKKAKRATTSQIAVPKEDVKDTRSSVKKSTSTTTTTTSTSKRSTQTATQKTKRDAKVTEKRSQTPVVSTTTTTISIPTPASPSTGKQSSSNPTLTKGSIKYTHVWQYEDKGWKNYDLKASDVVEEVYQGYLGNRGDTDVRAVKSGEWEYMVDFMAMKQTNLLHSNHTIRNIRRVPVSFV